MLEALTTLVVGMSKFGDYLLKRKVSSIIVAAPRPGLEALRDSWCLQPIE